MKKFTRSERRAMIERGKTAAIIALCLCCVIFLYSIWELYKGQVSIGQAFWGTERVPAAGDAKAEDVVASFRNYTEPEMVMVSQANNRAVLKTEDSLYVNAVSTVNDVVKSVYDCPVDAFEVADIEMFQDLTRNGMIYAKYPCVSNTSFEKPFVVSGESGMTTAIKKYRDVIVIPNASSDEGVSVLIQDYDSGQMFKVESEYPSKAVRNIISSCQYKKNNSLVFARELNLDTPKTNEAAVMLDSMFIIPLERTALNNISTGVPEKYAQGISFSHTNDFTTELLNVFGYNPNTVRQYAKDNGAVIFVGDTGSLSLYPNGKIEYKALGENEGISFITTGRIQADPRGVVSGLSGIINDVFSGCGVSAENSCASLRITEMPDMSNPAELRVYMEYYTDNNKILLGTAPAVDAVIRNGVLIELTMNVKTVKKTEKLTPCEDAFAAIDAFCEKNPQCKSIKNGSLVYKAFDDGKEVSAVWQIQGE